MIFKKKKKNKLMKSIICELYILLVLIIEMNLVNNNLLVNMSIYV